MTLTDQKIDVCVVTETHFTHESYLKLRGFEVYHTIHPRNCARGGSAVFVRTEISHHVDIQVEKEEFQVTSVKIKTTSGILTVAAIYCPPRHNLKRGDYLILLQSFTGKFIIGGDFNSKNTYWGSRLTNTKGSELYQAIRGYHLKSTLRENQHIGRQIRIRYQTCLTSLCLKTYHPVTSTSLKNSI
jgi:hypothetical protein